MKKIVSVDELPGWFDLRRYEFVKNLDHKWIWAELFYRASLFEMVRKGVLYLDNGVLKGPARFLGEWSEIEKFGSVKRIVRDVDWFGKTVKEMVSGLPNVSFVEDNRRLSEPLSTAVRPLSVSEIVCLAEEVLEIEKEQSDVEDFRSSHVSAIALKQDNEAYNPYSIIGIDLRFSDTLLIKEITCLLPKWRMEKIRSKVWDGEHVKATENDLGKVYQYRILPLLDLLVWSSIHSLRIPNSVLAAAIFPKGERGEVDMQKTIKVFALKMIDPHVLSEIEARA